MPQTKVSKFSQFCEGISSLIYDVLLPNLTSLVILRPSLSSGIDEFYLPRACQKLNKPFKDLS